MCSVFGIIDYEECLSQNRKHKILAVLSRVCEERGTDATGIAYHTGGSLRVYKRALAAHQMRFHLPRDARVIMGHTRMTTQGSAEKPYNNHPFTGYLGNKRFALAHNGVLWNDEDLRHGQSLPLTHIETDSYIAVQLIEQQKALHFDSLKQMAEQVRGSFVFTVLDEEHSIWFVRGDNPLAIRDYGSFILYASTASLLKHTERALRLPQYTDISTKEGDILRIDRHGKCSFGSFVPHHSYSHWWREYSHSQLSLLPEEDYWELDYLVDAAKAMGVSQDEVHALIAYGCELDEIEELLYDPALLHEITAEFLYV